MNYGECNACVSQPHTHTFSPKFGSPKMVKPITCCYYFTSPINPDAFTGAMRRAEKISLINGIYGFDMFSQIQMHTNAASFSLSHQRCLTQFACMRKWHWPIFYVALFYCRNGQFPAVLKHHQFNNFKRCFCLLKCMWKQSPGAKISRKFLNDKFSRFPWNFIAIKTPAIDVLVWTTMNLHATIESASELCTRLMITSC